MDALRWVLQGLAAVLYAASGVMKLFFFDKVSHAVPSFGALPRKVWAGLGVVELLCVAGLIGPVVLPLSPAWAALSAGLLAAESLVFIWVHLKYRETGALVMSAVLGILMACIACWQTLHG